MVVVSRRPLLPVVDEPLHHTVLTAMLKWGDDVALVDGVTDASQSFSELRSSCYGVASSLAALALCAHDVVSLSLPNCPQYVAFATGLMMQRVTVCLLNPNYHEYELEHYIADSGSKAVITTPAQLQAFCQVASKVSCLKHIFVLGDFDLRSVQRANPAIQIGRADDWLRARADFGQRLPTVDTRADAAFLLYSSGTTGLPKAVVHSHYTLAALIASSGDRKWTYWPSREDDCLLNFLPFSHVYGLFLWVVMIKLGTPHVILPRFDPANYLRIVQQRKVKALYIVPPVMVLLAKHPMVDKYDLSSVEAVFCGAAPAGRQLCMDLVARIPSVKHIVQGYGMSENGMTHVSESWLPIDKVRYGACGQLISNVEAKIVDTESGAELVGPHRTGEIVVRSPSIMLGYLNRPGQTAETVDEGGWLHTGDIGYYDEDEYFFIIDRKKELIKVNALQVAPAELEDVLLQQPAVADAAVVGVPDERTGERPVAFVVRKDGHGDVSPQHIQQQANGVLSTHKRISQVRLIDEIPKSSSGKILRRELKERLAEERNKAKL